MKYVSPEEYKAVYEHACTSPHEKDAEAFLAIDRARAEWSVYDFLRTGIPMEAMKVFKDNDNRYWIFICLYNSTDLVARIASDHVVIIKPKMSEELQSVFKRWCETNGRACKEWQKITSRRPDTRVLYAKAVGGDQQLTLPEPFKVTVEYPAMDDDEIERIRMGYNYFFTGSNVQW